jgi:hypothetical protein
MEAKCSSETSIDFQRTTRHYIPEDRTLHNHSCRNAIYVVLLYNPQTYYVVSVRRHATCLSVLQCVPGDAVRYIDGVRIAAGAGSRVAGPSCTNPPQSPETEEQQFPAGSRHRVTQVRASFMCAHFEILVCRTSRVSTNRMIKSRTCSTNGRVMHVGFSWENQKERDH